MEWPLFSSQKSSTYLGNVQVAPECSRLCVQHNDKFLQRQDYWRDTAPAAIDRTAVAKVDAHGVLLKSGDHHLGCIEHCKCWDKLSLTSRISEASTEGHLWLGGMLHNVAHPSQRKTTSTRKQESCFFSSTLVKDGELPVERCHHCRHLGGGNAATHCSHGLVIQIKSLSPARNTAGNTTETTGNPVEANQQWFQQILWQIGRLVGFQHVFKTVDLKPPIISNYIISWSYYYRL